MEIHLLRDPGIFPTNEVLAAVLGGVYPVYVSFMTAVGQEGLAHEWRYYNDGKSWLCKVTNKKKTVFWLSIWEGYFQIGFFFTEKHLEAIAALDIDQAIKEDFYRQKHIGRLIPMIFRISHAEQLKDLLTVVGFKKLLK
ncbi:MAG: DUF3788 domain-containing protein [Rikenellaceae bacterium]|nr:DUF3788 domain-containing protein [Rikenellaceae bacterium]MCL2693357.1 DUF3788 domain-containing protein [Rikenellaceae bacterium]